MLCIRARGPEDSQFGSTNRVIPINGFHRICAFLSLYDGAMGHNKRAEAREAAFRAKVGELRRVVITWKVDGPNWLVNFLDPRSRLLLTRQRVYQSPEPVRGMVARSMTTLSEGPRKVLFSKALEKGCGEIEVEITSTQFHRLRSS